MTLDYVGKSRQHRIDSPSHRHEVWELIYNVSGSGTMIIDDQPLLFDEGTVLLCPPETDHSKYAEHGFEDFFIGFTDSDLPRTLVVGQDTYDRRLLKLLQVLHSIWYESGPSPICSGLGETVLALIRPLLSGREKNEYVCMLRDTIAQNFTNPDFSIRGAMADIPLSADHLRRLFKQELGQTPQEYLTQLRMEQAKKFLSRSGDMLISEVAYLSGFYDPLYFSRSFRAYTGCAPKAWRPQ